MNRIIVKTQADMDRILDWTANYLEFSAAKAGRFTFASPFYSGEMIFQEEKASVQFACIDSQKVRFEVFASLEAFRIADDRFAGEKYIHICSFMFDYYSYEIEQIVFDERYVDIRKALEKDEKTKEYFRAFAVRWMALMLLSVHYHPEFERTARTVGEKKSGGKKKKGGKAAKTVYSRNYILDSSFVESLPGPKQSHAKPQHEFGVKGHYRQYKSGKRVWIRPHVRCKGRGKAEDSVYVARMAEASDGRLYL